MTVSNDADRRAGKYLIFHLQNEEYGMGILRVREIIGMMPITTVPRTPAHVKGVINLRGKVIPVMDLRMRFAMPQIPYHDRTCIIVVEMSDGKGTIGTIVDAVSEVVTIQETDIEAPPSLGTSVDTSSILGMAKTASGVKILVDIDQVLATASGPSPGN